MKPTEHLTITERPGTYITVMSDSRGPIIVVSDGPGARASRYTPEEAAKLGLAVLEAAGVQDTSTGGHITGPRIAMAELKHYVKREDEKAAEARERAELEAEALELFNVNQGINLPDWGKADRAVISSWVRVARRARELAKEATK